MDAGSELDDTPFVMMDTNPIAYVKPVQTEQGKTYGVFTSDGLQLALFSTQEAAYFAAKQHDLDPVLIH